MKKFLIGLVIVLAIIVLVVLTLLGLIPGLSPLLGAGQKDLGIKITKEDSVAAINKVGIEIISLPKETDPKDDYRLEGKKDVDIVMDSKEVTAHSNNRPWKNLPAKNIQVKINSDGSAEASGILIVAKALPYAMALGYSEEQIKETMAKYKIPAVEVPFYIKATGGVINNNVTANASSIKIGAVNIPSGIVAQASSEAESFLENLIQKHSESVNIENVSLSDGKVNFKGQLPEKEYVITE